MDIRKYSKRGKMRNYIFRPKQRKIIYARYLMQTEIGRTLRTEEVIHHINEDCLDDRMENLSIVSMAEHLKLHIGDKPPNRLLNDKDAETLKEMIKKRKKLSLRKLAKLLEFKPSLLLDVSAGRSYINI